MSDAYLEDDGYERVRSNSPLGKLLVNVRPGQRLSYGKPNGEPALVEILDVTD